MHRLQKEKLENQRTRVNSRNKINYPGTVEKNVRRKIWLIMYFYCLNGLGMCTSKKKTWKKKTRRKNTHKAWEYYFFARIFFFQIKSTVVFAPVKYSRLCFFFFYKCFIYSYSVQRAPRRDSLLVIILEGGQVGKQKSSKNDFRNLNTPSYRVANGRDEHDNRSWIFNQRHYKKSWKLIGFRWSKKKKTLGAGVLTSKTVFFFFFVFAFAFGARIFTIEIQNTSPPAGTR